MEDARVISLRRRIEGIDRSLVRLLNLRAAIARQIGLIKGKTGANVLDVSREAAVLEGVLRHHTGPLSTEHIKAIFTEVVSACRDVQGPTAVAFLGPEGTFTHLAVLRRFGRSINPIPTADVHEVFRCVESRRAHVGVVPLENSSEGSVNVTMDLLVSSPLNIVGEICLQVSHCLISSMDDLSSIKRVFSHPQAMAQCSMWLRKNLPHATLSEAPSTSEAVSKAREVPGSAAIGSEIAARTHGLRVLHSDIQDCPANYTRFAVLGWGICPKTGRDKTSFLFMVPHRSGTLCEALRPFAETSINLCRIESRPSRLRPWEYLFFVDAEGHTEDPPMRDAMEMLQRRASWSKVLGSYPMDTSMYGESRWSDGSPQKGPRRALPWETPSGRIQGWGP